jgi:selenocysteine-specific translation elongation factor
LPAVSAPEATGVISVSSASGQGIENLKEYLWKLVEQAKTSEADAAETEVFWSEEDG